MRAESMHRMCLGKSAFKEWAKAEKARRRIANQGKELRVYYCHLCMRFHLTSDLRENPRELKVPIPKIDPPALPPKPKKLGRYSQWCIDNCLKYPDLSVKELKKMAKREIRRQELEETIKRDIEWKNKFGNKSEISDVT